MEPCEIEKRFQALCDRFGHSWGNWTDWMRTPLEEYVLARQRWCRVCYRSDVQLEQEGD